jgi:spore maturation protein CgeB
MWTDRKTIDKMGNICQEAFVAGESRVYRHHQIRVAQRDSCTVVSMVYTVSYVFTRPVSKAKDVRNSPSVG